MGTSRPLLAAFILFGLVSLSCTLAQPVIDRIRSGEMVASAETGSDEESTRRRPPTLRPTFTPTPSYTDTPTSTATPTITPIPTDTPTPLPTDTPTATFTPAPTDTPLPTNPPPPPPAPTETFTPAPPTDTPTPDWPFRLKEQGNREFQKTSASIISDIIAITDINGTPLGGYHVVGEHSSGKTWKSAPSSWSYDATNSLEGYIKQGNVKFEPGGFEDGTWNVYVVDGGGTQLSEKVPLSYSSDPNQWVWDFLWWEQK